jgi:hypothetical protein
MCQPGVSDGARGLTILRKSDVAVELVRRDQFGFAGIPVVENLCGRRAPENARVDKPGELNVGDMPACAVDTLEIPDCFGAAVVCQYMPSQVAG